MFVILSLLKGFTNTLGSIRGNIYKGYFPIRDMQKGNVYCFGYSRKSPDDKENTETSIRNQNDLIKIVCKDNNWILVSIEEDRDISGSDRNRKGLNKQINDSKLFKKENKDKEVYIIVKDSKRFARDSSFSVEVLKELESSGVQVFSITKNGFLDYSDIGDRIMGVVDEQIIFDAKKYAKLTQELKMSKNLPSIPAPFGYKYGKDKNWVLEKKSAKIVQAIIIDYLNSINYKATIKKNKITKSKYYRIIKNASKGLYSGIIYYKKKNGEEVKYKGLHEPIISEDLYNEVNNVKS